MQGVIDDTDVIFVQDDNPNAEPRYRARFYFDPNALTMAKGNAHLLLRGYSGTSTVALRVEFAFNSGAYQVRAALLNDGSTWTNTSYVTISDAAHAIELDWRAATSAGANNGGLTMWIDGVQQADLTGIDNDTRRTDRLRLGATADLDSGTSGTYYFDAFESRRQTYIGLLAGGAPALALANESYKSVSYKLPSSSKLSPLQQSGLAATFMYDGDGKRVAQTINGVTTYFIGSHYEVTGSTITKYYFAGNQRVAMRTNTTLYYLLSDHLGSTSLTTNSSGAIVSELRYKAWGETRYSSGTTPTKYQYTGQYSNMSDFGLMFYNARWYDPYLNHFTQPDSIIPDPNNPQDWNRYAYARYNPLRYTDPTGHQPGDGVIFFGGSDLRNINLPGPNPFDDTLIWTTDQAGSPVNVVPYPGSQYAEKDDGRPYVAVTGKTQQAINAQGLLPDDNVDLIAYSAGTESALMYAQWRLENGQDVNSIVLLGPTFETSSMTFDEPNGGWSGVMDDLISQGVNIYILDDGDRPDEDIEGYQPPTGSNYGIYHRERDRLEHHSIFPNAPFGLGWWQGTNNSPRIKNDVYSWLANPQQ